MRWWVSVRVVGWGLGSVQVGGEGHVEWGMVIRSTREVGRSLGQGADERARS